MLKQEIISALEGGKAVRCEIWTYTKSYMDCDMGCCYQKFSTTEEAIEYLDFMCCDGDYSDVIIV